MNLQETLVLGYSKEHIKLIINYIGNDEAKFADLMGLFFKGEYRITQRAAWSVSHVVEKHPFLIQPYLKPMLENLLHNKINDAIARNTIKILSSLPNLEKQSDEVIGLAVDICFRYLADPSVAVAIRVYSMLTLAILCQREPELKEELKLIIEEHMPHESPAFRSLGSKILKKLDKK